MNKEFHGILDQILIFEHAMKLNLNFFGNVYWIIVSYFLLILFFNKVFKYDQIWTASLDQTLIDGEDVDSDYIIT